MSTTDPLDLETIPATPIPLSFYEWLSTQDGVANADYDRALKLAEDSGEAPSSMLVKLGLVAEKRLAESFATFFKYPLIEGTDFPDEILNEPPLSLRFMKESKVLVVDSDETENVMKVILADPADDFVKNALNYIAQKPLQIKIATASDIESAIERLYGEGRSAMGELVDNLDAGASGEDDIEHLRDLASEAPMIRLVNMLLQRAVDSRASDIHVEPFEDQLKVRYRIDGILHEAESPPANSTAAVISRIKIMSDLNIAERRLPQDGRIALRIQGKELDMRVSTVPTMFGESVVIRLLDKESVKFDFSSLGIDGEPLARLDQILSHPNGIALVTGPTGSGKSTSLYTALHKINTSDQKIITVEDPVEYQLSGVNQIQVQPQIGLDFKKALRAIVRQDPDVIMIGEMRDLETARIAVQSALTGHVVLSTLHTNDAAGGVTRLLDMGIEDYLLTSTINGILAQRLVRRLCDHCKEPHQIMPELVQELGLDKWGCTGTVYRAKGCSECGDSGFYGRLAVVEVLLMSNEIRKLVMSNADAGRIQQLAIEQGMDSMYHDGMRKVVAGKTTIDEILRACENV